MKNSKEFLISPDLENDNLTKEIEGINEAGESIKLPVVKEIPLTIYLNKLRVDGQGSRFSACLPASF